MPTEAEWEYACRAGSETALYGYAAYTADNMKRVSRCGRNNTTPDCEGARTGAAVVGSYEPNAFGLYDMLGNRMEWCLDWWESWESLDVDTTYENPVGAKTGTNRSARGGMYDNADGYISCGMRNYAYTPGTGSDSGYFGARFVLDIR